MQFPNIRSLFFENKLVVENYFFMTILQVLNSFFYIIIYPYLIRTLGSDSYGLYVFVMSVVAYFISIVNFGFDMPGVNIIAQNIKNKDKKAEVFSVILTSKIYLEVLCTISFFILIMIVPAFRNHKFLYFILYAQTLSAVLFPQWYFQGVQRMKVVTLIQLGYKLLTLPFIFFFVKAPEDVWKFAVIGTSGVLFGAITAFYIVVCKDGLKVKLQPFSKVKQWIKDSLPFFWTNAINTIKLQSVSLIIGFNFNLSDVALYDLANKIYSIPMTLTSSINGALFPKIVSASNILKSTKKIIRSELIIALFITVLLLIFGKYIIHIMGGERMMNAYPLLAILSFSSFTILISCYHYFVFVPLGLYKYIFYNQLTACVFFFLTLFIGLAIFRNILLLPISMSLAGFVEILYCSVIVNKKRILK